MPTVQYHYQPSGGLSELVTRLFLPRLRFNEMNEKILMHTRIKEFADAGPSWYTEHNDMIRSKVPKDRLLEYNVKEGYPPLCKFLGKSVPVDEAGTQLDFPRVNDTKAFQQRDRGLRIVVRVLIGINMALTAGVIGLVYTGVRRYIV